jgi:cellulose biosynthesis protein BcsQ
MKLVLIGSAHGGSGRTTTAVRLAEEAARRGIRAGIFDLSPWPAARFLCRDSRVFVANAREATSPVAAGAMIKAYRDRADIAFLDTGSLHDPLLAFWLTEVTHVLLTTRPSRMAFRALPGANDALRTIRDSNPRLEFLGFLITMTQGELTPELRAMRAAFQKYTINTIIPFGVHEKRRAQEHAIAGLDEVPLGGQDSAAIAYAKLAEELVKRLQLSAPKVQEETTEKVGMLARVWKLAAEKLRKPTVVRVP